MNQSLSTMYPLSQDQVDQHQRDGHILLKDVASQEEVNAVCPLIVGHVDEMAKAGETQGRISDYRKMFTQHRMCGAEGWNIDLAALPLR
jgi:hypothetical protein